MGRRILARRRASVVGEGFVEERATTIVDEESPKIGQKRSILYLTAPHGS
jgi:hypothetical protein